MSRLERTFLVIALLAALAIAWATRAHAAPAHFHIDAGPAPITLNEFSRQASLQIFFDFTVVQGRSTQPVEGDFEPEEALRGMLKDSNLSFDWVNPRTLAITAEPPEVSREEVTAAKWVRETEWVDENGYIDCAPLRYTLTLLGYTQPRWDGHEICLRRGMRVAQVERP